MTIFELLSISIALALDASGVSFSIGFDKKINRTNAKWYIFSFAFFQFLFSFIGGFCGSVINKFFFKMPNYTGGIILIILGIFMILGLFSKNENINVMKWYMIIVLGISVSIDALLVGFSVFYSLSITYLFIYSSLIGLVTAILSAISFNISRYMKSFPLIESKSDLISGSILIIIGAKMIIF